MQPFCPTCECILCYNCMKCHCGKDNVEQEIISEDEHTECATAVVLCVDEVFGSIP